MRVLEPPITWIALAVVSWWSPSLPDEPDEAPGPGATPMTPSAA